MTCFQKWKNKTQFAPFQFEGHCPLAKGKLLKHPTIVEVASRVEATPAQVLIAWSLQHGVITIPKSTKCDRVKENALAVNIRWSKRCFPFFSFVWTIEATPTMYWLVSLKFWKLQRRQPEKLGMVGPGPLWQGVNEMSFKQCHDFMYLVITKY